MTPPDLHLVETVGRIETAGGQVQVLLHRAAAVYELSPAVDSFEQTVLALFRSWRDQTDVSLRVIGNRILSARDVPDG